MSDEITYDYPTIDLCVNNMKSKAESIIAQADQMKADVHGILQGWTGTSAGAYDEQANQLTNDLHTHEQILTDLQKSLGEGAENMRLQDQKGAAQLNG
ncbi:WXG100 family type VII secretion target [Amycolatopsis sp. WQ 127309]|uniref:WXG100 family type VII secretion target n=1 Tax=Amycolatopsis sp. WQ 127309 TaxID=2932773 RepID=UPI001FF39373|nr:WXG100 family type VII secretion target [Amycolatopsis sp. WQ 127309]UOZ06917.1 WXG100 family type VII secretion target [Amycolatopsis sp. WQ 127309]